MVVEEEAAWFTSHRGRAHPELSITRKQAGALLARLSAYYSAATRIPLQDLPIRRNDPEDSSLDTSGSSMVNTSVPSEDLEWSDEKVALRRGEETGSSESDFEEETARYLNANKENIPPRL